MCRHFHYRKISSNEYIIKGWMGVQVYKVVMNSYYKFLRRTEYLKLNNFLLYTHVRKYIQVSCFWYLNMGVSAVFLRQILAVSTSCQLRYKDYINVAGFGTLCQKYVLRKADEQPPSHYSISVHSLKLYPVVVHSHLCLTHWQSFCSIGTKCKGHATSSDNASLRLL